MRVKCIYNFINAELAKKVSLAEGFPIDYSDLTVGKEYIVLGLSYLPSSQYFAGKPVISIVDDAGDLCFAPIFLFKIIEPKPSKFWIIQYNEDGSLEMLPKSFYQDFYYDDLSEGVPEIKADFERVLTMFEKESADSNIE